MRARFNMAAKHIERRKRNRRDQVRQARRCAAPFAASRARPLLVTSMCAGQTAMGQRPVVSLVVWKNSDGAFSRLTKCTTSRPPCQRPPEERAMGKSNKEAARTQELEPLSLSALIHREIRVAIETAVHEELRTALGTTPYERSEM